MNFRAPAGALLLLLVSSLNLAAARRPLPFSDYDSLKRRSVHVFSDQFHSVTEAEARFAATRYVGAQKLTLPSIRRIRNHNPDFIHLHYKLAITVDSIADYGMILDGQWFSDNRSPESNWGQVRVNPDWFLLDGNRNWTVHGGRRMIMDIANPGFRDWWVTSCIREMTANECDGVFADTYTIEATSFQTTNTALFNSVEALTSSWLPKLNDWGKNVHARLDSAGFYFFPNIDNLQTGWVGNAGAHYYAGDFMHAAMMEGWGDWSAPSDAEMALAHTVQIQKKGVFLHAEGYFGGSHSPNPDLSLAEQRMWLTGTYLLANHGRLYLSMYGPGELEMSGRLLWFPEFELDLGPWKSEWSSLAQVLYNGVLRREYEKGWVLCNVSANPRTLVLPDTMYLARDNGATDEYWADRVTGRESVALEYVPVTSVEMPRMSAAVVLFEKPAAVCEMALPGDFDGNGVVDLRDVAIMAREIARGSEDPCLDFNGDGRRNVFDILQLILAITGMN